MLPHHVHHLEMTRQDRLMMLEKLQTINTFPGELLIGYHRPLAKGCALLAAGLR
jgi:hypothetical protein